MQGFSNLWLPDEVLAAFPPDREALSQVIASEITDRMLGEIAQSDSYSMHPGANYVALKSLRDGGSDVPEEAWAGEAMSLFLHRKFDQQFAGWNHRQFHMARAFCAYQLLDRPGRANDIFSDAYGQTLPILTMASLELDAPFRMAFARLITWSLRHLGSNAYGYLEQVFILFFVAAHEAASDDANVSVLAKWIDQLSEEYDLDNFILWFYPSEFHHWYSKPETPWLRSGLRSLRDRLPLESELRFAVDQILATPPES